MSAEAWKDTGDCRECRRQKYCKNQCSKAKAREQAEARNIVRGFMRAKRFSERLHDTEALKEELRATEKSIIGECSEQKVEAVYSQCHKLATHSTFGIRAVVSALCATSRERGQSIVVVVKDMEERLQVLATNGR